MLYGKRTSNVYKLTSKIFKPSSSTFIKCCCFYSIFHTKTAYFSSVYESEDGFKTRSPKTERERETTYLDESLIKFFTRIQTVALACFCSFDCQLLYSMLSRRRSSAVYSIIYRNRRQVVSSFHVSWVQETRLNVTETRNWRLSLGCTLITSIDIN